MTEQRAADGENMVVVRLSPETHAEPGRGLTSRLGQISRRGQISRPGCAWRARRLHPVIAAGSGIIALDVNPFRALVRGRPADLIAGNGKGEIAGGRTTGLLCSTARWMAMLSVPMSSRFSLPASRPVMWS
jgi:hypothetical protein